MRLDDDAMDGVRVLTDEEFEQMRGALRDPDYIKRLYADTKAMEMVEVDNPTRREVRPRRGAEKHTTTEEGATSELFTDEMVKAAAPGHVETYVIHHDDGTWVRDSTRWTWYCTGGECGDADETNASNGAVDPLPNWATAMEALVTHQLTQHTCRRCNGEGNAWAWPADGVATDMGVCQRCKGWGVDLSTSERSGA